MCSRWSKAVDPFWRAEKVSAEFYPSNSFPVNFCVWCHRFGCNPVGLWRRYWWKRSNSSVCVAFNKSVFKVRTCCRMTLNFSFSAIGTVQNHHATNFLCAVGGARWWLHAGDWGWRVWKIPAEFYLSYSYPVNYCVWRIRFRCNLVGLRMRYSMEAFTTIVLFVSSLVTIYTNIWRCLEDAMEMMRLS